MTQEEREPEAPTTAAPAATQDDPEGAPTPAPRTGARGAATRERIVDAAAQLFYAQGLRAVSADRIIELAGITKVTFYRHFRTKDDLIVAYLERRAAWERDAVRGASEAAHGDVDETLRMVSTGIGAEACTAGFRGCPFINAAAEYADPEHPVRRVVDSHRAWFLSALTQLTEAAGIEGGEAADELMMLRDGAMVSGYLGDATHVSAALLSASRAVIATRR
ncbi:AcrR family transcriptional regulator [Clavibacter sp. B3I6]|jgi:AcrR family transcriptional regulator|uniref:TetR/AcrR family transcriptional regulator n=1 Tax=Clavibacter sp. B3I6 TaxID=3042268 RepID=UPI00278500FF|nr:TetR/AcrR family transcriptional regulator [Clavibacter sp. B3I6]MDQ0744436.1 AcrR family transcriptional regulator [Clavibacter sp. B3I6]